MLACSGFDVVLLRNADKRCLEDRMADFASTVPVGSTVVLFFAGHGVCMDGVNYLLPVDANAAGESPPLHFSTAPMM